MASNSTISISFKIDGDNGGLKMMARDTDGLRKAMTAAIAEAGRLDAKLVNFAAISTAVTGAQAAIGSLQSALGEYTLAYAVQQQAETQLEEVMRQRMGATAAEIQGIKDLASAQQALGVIGDEVQLAGAQQVATFLNEKASIATLLPAMNDLLAQQKGLNATSTDAVAIGNLVGKAMQGQTSALTRVGITFNAAQEQIMKYGDESLRAATLAEIITQNVGHMNAKLAQTDSGKMKQLENDLGDVGEKIGKLANSAMPFLSMAAAVTVAAGGVVKLVTGIRTAVAVVGAWNIRAKSMVLMCKLVGVEASRSAVVTRIFASALRGGAYSATAFKLALRGLLITTGIGAAIAALCFIVEMLINAMDGATDSTNDLLDAEARAKRESEALEEAQRQERQTLEGTRAALAMNISRLKEFNGSKAEEKKLVKEMNDTYGDTMGYFSSVSDWYKTLITNSEDYCRQMVLEARARMLANQIAQKQQENHDITHNEDGSVRMYSTKRETRVDTSAPAANTYGIPGAASEGRRRVEIEGTSEKEKAQAAYEANTASIQVLTKELDKVIKESAEITYKAKGSTNRQDGEASTSTTTLTEQQRAEKVDVSEVMSRNKTTVSEFDKALEELRLKQKYVGQEEYATIQRNIETVETERSAFIGLISTLTEKQKAEGIDVSEVMSRNKTTVIDFDKALEELRLKQRYASAEEYTALQRNITTVESDRDAFISLGQAMTEAQKADAIDITEVMGRNLRCVADYDKAIQQLSQKQRYASAEEYKTIQESISTLERRREEFTTVRTPVNEGATNLREISANIETLTKDLETATETEAAMINRQIDAWNRKADAIRNAGKESSLTFETLRSGWGSVKNLDGSLKSLGETLRGNNTLWEKAKAVIDAFITVAESIRTVVSIIQMLTMASKAHTLAKGAETAATLTNTTATAAAAAEAPVAAAAELPLIATNKSLAASYLEAAAAAYMAAHASIPFAGFAIGSGFAASAAAIVKGIGLMAFANGGIAYGPTLGLFGEYAGAASNPEVVAPLDKLRELIQPEPSGIVGEVEFKIKGEALVGVLKRTNNRINRTI